jgi:hypothetical protein
MSGGSTTESTKKGKDGKKDDNKIDEETLEGYFSKMNEKQNKTASTTKF